LLFNFAKERIFSTASVVFARLLLCRVHDAAGLSTLRQLFSVILIFLSNFSWELILDFGGRAVFAPIAALWSQSAALPERLQPQMRSKAHHAFVWRWKRCKVRQPQPNRRNAGHYSDESNSRGVQNEMYRIDPHPEEFSLGV